MLLTAQISLGTRLSKDISIRDTNLQLVIVEQLQEIIDQIIDNNQLLKEIVNGIGAAKVKLLLVERFMGKRLKLKGFLIQIRFKVIQEEVKLATPIN